MNTIDATPHVSVGDASPCSVGATCSLNCGSVLIPRNARERICAKRASHIDAIAIASAKSPRSCGAMPLHAASRQIFVCRGVRLVSDGECYAHLRASVRLRSHRNRRDHGKRCRFAQRANSFSCVAEFGLFQTASAARIILARSTLRYGLASSSTPGSRWPS
jgi:hypothetical protein